MSQRPRLSAHQQPTLPLIKMREDHLKLRRKHLPGFVHDAHTTATSQPPRSYGLFLCNPLASAYIIVPSVFEARSLFLGTHGSNACFDAYALRR